MLAKQVTKVMTYVYWAMDRSVVNRECAGFNLSFSRRLLMGKVLGRHFVLVENLNRIPTQNFYRFPASKDVSKNLAWADAPGIKDAFRQRYSFQSF